MKKIKEIILLLLPICLCLISTPVCHANSVKNNNNIINLQRQINNKNKEIDNLKH